MKPEDLEPGDWIEVPRGVLVHRTRNLFGTESKRKNVVRVVRAGYADHLRQVPRQWSPCWHFSNVSGNNATLPMVAWKGSGGYWCWCKLSSVRKLHDLELLARVRVR